MVNLNAVAEIWKDFDLLRLEEDFNAICRKNGYNVSELEYLPIMLYAGISIERMLHHNYMGRDRLNEERGKNVRGSAFLRGNTGLPMSCLSVSPTYTE